MKKTLLLAAALMIASPAFAQSYDPDLGSGNIAPAQAAPQRTYRAAPPSAYTGAEGAFARVGGEGAYARVNPARRAPNAVPAPYVVQDEYGHVIGADPDPNVRLQLRKDNDSIGGF